MGKKKTTKVRQMWTGTKQVIDMGNEIAQDEMRANEIYSVLMLSKGEGSLNFAWGIVVTDNYGDIYKNYNVNATDKWDSNPCVLKKTWKVFPANQMARELANLYLTVITLNADLKRTIHKYEHQSLWERVFNR